MTPRLTLTPLISDQELYGGSITCWKGAVQITGNGYAELTGCASAMAGRF